MKNVLERTVHKCFYYSFYEFKTLVEELCNITSYIDDNGSEPFVSFGDNNIVETEQLVFYALGKNFDCEVLEILVTDKDNVLIIADDDEKSQREHKFSQNLLNIARLQPASKGIFYKDGYEQAKRDIVRLLCGVKVGGNKK